MSAMILKEITNLTIAELRTWLTEFHLSFLSIPEPERDGMRRELMRALHDVGGLSVLGLTMDAYDEAADMIGLPPRSEPDPKTGNWTATGDFDPHASITPAVVDHFIEWSSFWDRAHEDAEWVFSDVLARGRGHSLYAAHKDGKSLFMLYVAARLATGKDKIVVVYLDYEMTEADIFDRLEDMGYGPDTDLSRLRYALLPTLPPLDTAEGSAALMELVDGVQAEWPEHHLVVIIDTISRAVCGEENSADTFRAFYSHTGIALKRRGLTWARLDHAGKSKEQGQRGSSGKGDDVDLVWKLTRTQNGIHLHRDFSRMPWVPEHVTFGLSEEPLSYKRLAGDWPDGTGETANVLDRLKVPLEASTRVAQAALRSIGEGRRRQVVIAAIRWRRERAQGSS